MKIEPDKLLIYTPLITDRLNYTFSFVLNNVLGLEYEVTDNQNHFKQSTQAKLIYARETKLNNIPFIKAHSLLFEKKIRAIQIELFNYKNRYAFFQTTQKSFFPFDLFAAIFYLISRYEEYLPFKPDKYNRFTARESLAVKAGFLEEPIVDIWCIDLKYRLLKLFPKLSFKIKNFQFLSTIDIDNAYAHLHKGFARTLLSLIKLLVLAPPKLIEKIKVLKKEIPDPYDSYDYLEKIHKTRDLEPIYFILFSKYGKFDKNITAINKSFQSLIKRISSKHKVGLHPSYRSSKNIDIVRNEKKELENVIRKSINVSRQHFLKLRIPDTYEKLIDLNIEEDYSMGYASSPGFRAGTCTSFYFFNLKKNEESSLKIIPFAIMDVCFKHYLQSSPEEALKKIKKIITSVKKVEGLFVSLWHNETLTPNTNQLSWRDVFERMLDAAKNGN